MLEFIFQQFLQNMAFQADQRIKVQIITALGSDQIFRLLSDQDIDVVMKTLGLLRNLLSTNKSQIDHVMTLYGKQVNNWSRQIDKFHTIVRT